MIKTHIKVAGIFLKLQSKWKFLKVPKMMFKTIFVVLYLEFLLDNTEAIVAKGRLIQPFDVKPNSDFCQDSSSLFKRFCNGADDDICTSTGFIVSFLMIIKFWWNHVIFSFSVALQSTKCRCSGKWKVKYEIETNENECFQFPCSGNTPYCVEDSSGQAKCSATSDCSAKLDSDFVCLNEGIFPDPLDCKRWTKITIATLISNIFLKRYYYCYQDDTIGLSAQLFECPNLYVFDPSLSDENPCRLTYNTNYCITAKCNKSYSNILMSYPTLPRSQGQIGVTCMGEDKPVVFRCKSNFIANLNTLPVECELQCRSGLRVPYPNDNQKYYDCYFDGRIWTPRVISCLRNQYFDEKNLKCENLQYTTTTTTTTTTQAPTQAPTDAPTEAPSDD
jgi:hypothetical protein